MQRPCEALEHFAWPWLLRDNLSTAFLRSTCSKVNMLLSGTGYVAWYRFVLNDSRWCSGRRRFQHLADPTELGHTRARISRHLGGALLSAPKLLRCMASPSELSVMMCKRPNGLSIFDPCAQPRNRPSFSQECAIQLIGRTPREENISTCAGQPHSSRLSYGASGMRRQWQPKSCAKLCLSRSSGVQEWILATYARENWLSMLCFVHSSSTFKVYPLRFVHCFHRGALASRQLRLVAQPLLSIQYRPGRRTTAMR